MTTSPTPSTPDLQIVRAFKLLGSTIPDVQGFSKAPGSGSVLDVAMFPNMVDHFYVTGPGSVSSSTLWKLNLLTGQSTAVLTGTNLRRVVFDRFGVAHVQDGDTISAYDLTTSPPTPGGSRNVGIPADSIVSDDRLDQIVVLTQVPASGGPRQLQIFPHGLGANATVLSLALALAGDGSVAPDPTADATYWFCGSQSRIVSRQQIVGGALQQLEFFTLPAGVSPTGLTATADGHLLFSSGGVMFDYFKPAGGGWGPFAGSLWAGKPGGARLSASRTRTNFDPAIHSGPEFQNIAAPEIAPGVADCYANCDGSTVTPLLTAGDFICFLGKFRAGADMTTAQQVASWVNCDESTTPPVLSASDFTCFLAKFRAGCP